MGHTYAEMHYPGEETFPQRYVEYQQRCAREISDIIEKNPIKNEDIEIGDRIGLYEPLLGLSKVRFENEGRYNPIRALFASTAHYYSMNMWVLAYEEQFRVFGKRTVTEPVSRDDLSHEKILHLIRVDEPSEFLDWNPYWIDIRYFSKKS